jgi:hypothetical protein
VIEPAPGLETNKSPFGAIAMKRAPSTRANTLIVNPEGIESERLTSNGGVAMPESGTLTGAGWFASVAAFAVTENTPPSASNAAARAKSHAVPNLPVIHDSLPVADDQHLHLRMTPAAR